MRKTTAAIVTTLMAVPMALGLAQTTFKSGVELVRLDVSVMRDGRPLRGLTADDFLVTDNGVPEQIQSVSLEAAPLNVVMVLDASGSVRGEKLAHLIDAATAVSTDLHDDDRGALITFSESVERPVPLTGDRGHLARALRTLNGSGGTALRDAILVALAQTQDDGRPTVLLIFSDGRDTASWLTERNLLDVVRRVRPVVHAIEIPEGRVAPSPSPLMPGRSPNAAAPASEPPSFLATLTRAAGGRYRRVAQPEQLRDVFRAALDEMRTRYELTFYPVGTSKSGWHRLDVRLKRGSATIAARPGYFVP